MSIQHASASMTRGLAISSLAAAPTLAESLRMPLARLGIAWSLICALATLRAML